MRRTACYTLEQLATLQTGDWPASEDFFFSSHVERFMATMPSWCMILPALDPKGSTQPTPYRPLIDGIS